MIAFFTLCYGLGIWLIFYQLKIKPRPWNIATAVVIGIVAIGAIVILWKFSAPSSSNLLVSRYTIQLVPQVRGPITKIHAEPNVPLKKGQDILFEIQPDLYQYAVDQFKASLLAARQNVLQQEAGQRMAAASVKRAEANQSAAKAELEVAEETAAINPAAVAKIRVTQLSEQFNAATAAVTEAEAALEQSKAAVQSARSTVESVEAQLAKAEFDLKQCVVYAPADGFVTNWQVREGTMVAPLPMAAVGTFIDTTKTMLVANFGQHVVTFVESGDPIEVTFKTKPGEVYPGVVAEIIQASGEGQSVTSGVLFSAEDLQSSGMFVLKFELDDKEIADQLAMGTAGNIVIYSKRGKPFHVISKVMIRMKAWMYYLNPFS